MNEGPTHYGPIYGRKGDVSMALCKPGLLPGGSNAMSRSVKMVWCQHCLDIINAKLQAVIGQEQSSEGEKHGS